MRIEIKAIIGKKYNNSNNNSIVNTRLGAINVNESDICSLTDIEKTRKLLSSGKISINFNENDNKLINNSLKVLVDKGIILGFNKNNILLNQQIVDYYNDLEEFLK